MQKPGKDFDKLFTALKYYLLGKGYFIALKALDFAKHYHNGFRKDGVTPELQHQIEICLYITTLPDIQDEETALAAALLHDVMEDFDIEESVMVNKFGIEITREVRLLSKKYKGIKKSPEYYFHDIAASSVSSIVKGSDRIHNIQSMVGVFTFEKQRKYIDEVEQYFIPMLKDAKYNFPEQSKAYFNIIHMLRNQLELIKALHEGVGFQLGTDFEKFMDVELNGNDEAPFNCSVHKS